MIDSMSALLRLHELKFDHGHASDEEKRRIKKEIDRCRAELDPELLQRYETLKGRYGRTALVQMENNTCMGCFISIPASKAENITDELGCCEQCGRLLYNPEHAFDTSLYA
ncbi:MAG: hypothetical protein V2A74_14995 [bacterium]